MILIKNGNKSSNKKDEPSIKEFITIGSVTFVLYLLIYLSTALGSKNGFDTLAYPVGFYVFSNILIRNLVNEREGKRLSDFNDGLLISYVIVYLTRGTNIDFMWFWLFLLLYLILFILFIKWILGINKNSVWHKDNKKSTDQN